MTGRTTGRTERLVRLLTGLTIVTLMAAIGCDFLKKGKDDKDEETAATAEPAPPPPEPTATATDTATAEASEESDEVKTYPDMQPHGGTYRLLRQFVVYQAADATSKEITRVASGTICNFKFRRGEWRLIEYPSGPGELSPGWIQLRATDERYAKKIEQRRKCSSSGDCGGKACCYVGLSDMPTHCGDDTTCSGFAMPIVCRSNAECPAYKGKQMRCISYHGGYQTCKPEEPEKTEPTTTPDAGSKVPAAPKQDAGKRRILIKRPF